MAVGKLTAPKHGLAYELAKYAGALRGVPPDMLLSKDRSRHIAHVRFAIMWALREYNPRVFSYPNIAVRLGFEDHTSIMHGYYRACARRDNDFHFRQLTDRLLAFAKSRAPYLDTETRPAGGWADRVIEDDQANAA